MPIDPRILLSGQVADVTNPILRGLEAGRQIRQAPLQDALLQERLDVSSLGRTQTQQNIDQSAELFPIKKQYLEAQLKNLNNQVAKGDISLQEAQERSKIFNSAANAVQADAFVSAEDYAGLEQFALLDAQEDAQTNPVGAQRSMQIAQLAKLAQTGDVNAVSQLQEFAAKQSQQAQQIAQKFGVLGSNAPANLREFEAKTAGLTPEQKERARLIDLGLEPRAVGSADITIAESGKTDIVGESVADIAGKKSEATESGKLAAKLKLEPQVKSAVIAAEQAAQNIVDVNVEDRSNTKAFNVYNTAMNGLTEALSKADTGPFVGFIPAVTSNQQIADGAVAAMAPVLKQMFRSAGEGTFTDQDQKLLLQMVPTRKDTPEARVSKIQNIDAIVKAKLNIQEAPPQVDPDVADIPRVNDTFIINGVEIRRIK